MVLEEFQILLSIVDSISSVAILAALVIAFYQGRIIPRAVVEEIVKGVIREVVEDAISEAVKESMNKEAERRRNF